MKTRVIQAVAYLTLFLAVVPLRIESQGTGTIQYVYDDAGRLIEVVDQNGNLATYSYDAVGNLLSITRSVLPSNNGLAVLNFTPQSGLVGQSVVIQGQGFSTTPSANAVSFNGTLSAVSAATASSLTVTVPPGATTGPISVTVGTQTATSGAKFIVVPPTLTAVRVSPASANILIGKSQQLNATALYNNGSQQDVTSLATWTSSNTSVATVNSTGLVSAGTQALPIQALISATYNGFTGFANVRAAADVSFFSPPISIAISPANLSIPKGIQQAFTATGTFSDGTTGDVTAEVTWTSSNPAVATVSNASGSHGVVSDTGVGTTTITASSTIVSSSTALTLTPPVATGLVVGPATVSVQVSGTAQLSANLQLTDGTTQDATQTATWTTSSPSIATVGNSPGNAGVVTGVGVGNATITATSGTFSATSVAVVNAPTSTTFPRFLYVSNGSPGLSIFSVNSSTGQLRSAGAVATSASGYLALDPLQQYLYLAEPGTGTVSAYTVNPASGSLTQIAGSPYTVSAAPGPIVAEPSDRFLYVADTNSSTISAFAIGNGGALTSIPGSPFPASGIPDDMAVHPSGKYLFVTYNAQNVQGTVSVFSIDQTTGALTEIPGSPSPTGYTSVALAEDPAGRYLYVVNTGQNFGSRLYRPKPAAPGNSFDEASTSLHTRHRNGSALVADLNLADLPPLSVTRQWDLASPLPMAAMLFQSVSTAPSISAFSIDPTSGALTELAGSPFPFSVVSLSISANGKYAYGPTGNSVLGFSIDPASGALTQLPDSPYAARIFSGKILFDPSGQFAYASDSNGVQEFGINSSTGTLTPLAGGGSTAGGVFSLAISGGTSPISYVPQYAYVTSAGGSNGGNSISAYTIDTSTGMLNPIVGSPFAEGFSPVFVTTDLLAQYLYIANACSDTACSGSNGSVSVFAVDPNSGMLTTVAGSPFQAGVTPVSVVVQAPPSQYVYALSQSGLAYEFTSTAGSLSAFPGSPEAISATGAVAAVSDPLGVLLYVAAKCPTCSNGTLYAYNLFLFNGQLIYQTPFLTAPIGPSPQSVSLDPPGHFVFVTDGSANSVYVFSTLNQFQVPGSPFTTGQSPAALAVDPTSRFVYVANQGSNNVTGFTLDSTGGTLTPMAGSPFPAGAGPVSLAVDFSGRYLYVTNKGDNTVTAFSIDSTSGVLTLVSQSPFPTGGVPISIVTTGTTK